jgi:transposase-like protein
MPRRHGVPETITVHGSEANAAAIRRRDEGNGTPIDAHHVRDLNTLVKRDHRAVTHLIRALLGLKSCEAAQCTWSGRQRMPMLKTGLTGGGEGGGGACPHLPTTRPTES